MPQTTVASENVSLLTVVIDGVSPKVVAVGDNIFVVVVSSKIIVV